MKQKDVLTKNKDLLNVMFRITNNKDDIEFVTELPCFLGHPVKK